MQFGHLLCRNYFGHLLGRLLSASKHLVRFLEHWMYKTYKEKYLLKIDPRLKMNAQWTIFIIFFINSLGIIQVKWLRKHFFQWMLLAQASTAMAVVPIWKTSWLESWPFPVTVQLSAENNCSNCLTYFHLFFKGHMISVAWSNF